MLELSRRGEDSGCSVAEVDASEWSVLSRGLQSDRNWTVISNVLNNGSISILSSSKRSDCNVVGVTAGEYLRIPFGYWFKC